jgi:hypothetical protein
MNMDISELKTRVRELIKNLPPIPDDLEVSEAVDEQFAEFEQDQLQKTEGRSPSKSKKLRQNELYLYGMATESFATGLLFRRIETAIGEIKDMPITTETVERINNVIADEAARTGLPFEWAREMTRETASDAKKQALFAPLTFRREDHAVPCLRRLHIRVDPSVVTPDQLLNFYRQERKRTLSQNSKQGLGAPPSLRALMLAGQRLLRPRASLKELMADAPKPRTYKGASGRDEVKYSNFSADLKRAVRSAEAWCAAPPATESEFLRRRDSNRRRALPWRDQLRAMAEDLTQANGGTVVAVRQCGRE